MGAMAARVAWEQTERAATVLAIHAIALAQLTHLQSHGRAPGDPSEPPAWLPRVEGFTADRPLRADTARVAAALLSP
jgi:histidine ammonia-lyase